MYGLSCAQTKDEDEEQSSKSKIRAIKMMSGHFGRIDFELMCAFICSSIWIFGIVLVATELQQRYNLSVECASIRRQPALQKFVSCCLRSVATEDRTLQMPLPQTEIPGRLQ